jgi:hypothetical protein
VSSWAPIISLLVVLAVPAPAPDGGPISALDRLASAVLAQAQLEPIEGPVGVFVTGDIPSLDRAFATVLIARISAARFAGVPIAANDFSSAEASARKLGTRSLIRLELSVRDGQLFAVGDLISTWVNFWSGRVPTRAPRPAGVLRAAVGADAEALALAALKPTSSPASARFELERVATLPGPIAALAAGDLTGDGTPQILVLSETALLAMDPTGRLLGQMPLPKAPALPPRIREPFGSLVVLEQPARVAYVGVNSARPAVVAFDAKSASFREVEGLTEAPAASWNGQLLTAPLLPGRNAFGSILSVKGETLLETRRSIQGCSTLKNTDGEWMLIAFSDGGGAVYRRGGFGSRPEYQLSGLGAGSALINVAAGAAPKVATTASAYAPSSEELRVWSLDEKSPSPATVALGPGKAWYTARLPRKDKPDQLIVAVLRPDASTELLRVTSEP